MTNLEIETTHQPDWLGRNPPAPTPVPASDGPIFCATFDDGVAVRMSTYAFNNKLDDALERGIKLALAAYSTRCRVPAGQISARIVEGHFESKETGDVLKSFGVDELAKAKHA